HGIYHRDLKPENFIMDTNGDLKLTDFGLATTLRTSVNFECGSRSYMSYENRNGGLNADDDTVYGPNQEYSPRLSDVWALGVLLLNLLFADSPWQDPCVDSCFKFCDFLRDGSRYLQIRYPKIPRKIADYLSNNIFCPERNRSSVLDFKLWIADLRASMNPSSRKPAVSNSWKVFGSHKKHNGHKHKKHQRLPEPERGHPVEIHIISPKKYSSSPHSNLYSGFPVPVAASSHAHSRSIQINPSSRSGTSSFGFPQNPIIKSNSPPVSALSSSVPAHVHSKIMPVPRPPALLAETGRSNKPAAILSSHKNISTTSPPDSFSNDCDSTLKPTSFSSGIPINSSAASQSRPFINAHAHSDVALKSLASSVGGGVNLMGGVVGFARIREASATRSYGSSSTASFLGSSSKHRASNGSLFPTNNLHSNGSYSTKLQLSTIAASTVNSSTDSLVENLPNTLNLAMNIPNDHSLRNPPSNLSKQSPIKDTRILHPADDLFAMKLVSLNSNSSVDSLDIFDME
ncbi:Serine/threonine-protein kinase ksp1, partial [Zancudomyces culisetae]